MTLKELKTDLQKIAPTAYRCFKKAVKPPFICYFVEKEYQHGSDYENYITDKALVIELYAETRYTKEEKAIDKYLSGYEFTKNEVYLNDEKLYQIIWDVQTIEKL